MPERGIKISLHTRGSEVAELHKQLRAIGYQVPANELEKTLVANNFSTSNVDTMAKIIDYYIGWHLFIGI